MSRYSATFQDWQRATGWGPLPVAESIGGPADTGSERRDQGAQDFHDASFVILTESRKGLGLPNEVMRPDGKQQKASLPTHFQHITEE